MAVQCPDPNPYADAGAPGYSDMDSSLYPPGYPPGSTAPQASDVHVLDYRVVDAEQSTALSSIVMVSDTPVNALHIYDPSTAADRSVPLPTAPVAVSVDATGLKAAVAYDAHVSLVDLSAGTVITTCNLSSNAYDLALAQTGIVYVIQRTDQWVPVHIIDMATCKESSVDQVWASGRIALHPSEKVLFLADRGLYPTGLQRCRITTPGAVVCDDAVSTLDWGREPICGRVWLSADGQRVYTGCGVTLNVPTNLTVDPAKYSGVLPGVTLLEHLSDAPIAKRVVMVPGVDPGTNPYADTAIRVHETDFLALLAQYELPKFPTAGTSTAFSHGRFVFTTPTMDRVYVVVQADPGTAAAKDFGIATLTP